MSEDAQRTALVRDVLTSREPLPDRVLSDQAREGARRLFWSGPMQVEGVPGGMAALLELRAAGYVEQCKGWYYLTHVGIDAALARGWGREKERSAAT